VSRRRIVVRGLFAGIATVAAASLVTIATTGSGGRAAGWPGWGFTHTQYSADTGSPMAIESVEDALQGQSLVQVQAIMGWGAENPEPAPGQHDWASLDRRIDLIRSSGGTAVITLCCAPDWMKGGSTGDTDWDRLTVAPLPEHYADFARLAAAVAERYPDVHYFLVWNEFKGFWDDAGNQWDAEGYTAFYNEVYEAVKEVNPDAQVGGPYIPMVAVDEDVLEDADQNSGTSVSPLEGSWGAVDPRVLRAFDHWLANNAGADFIVVDGHAEAHGSSDPFAAVRKFSAVNQWIHERTSLPVWWAEWYLDPGVQDWPAQEQLAVYTAAMIEFARSGTETALHWNPRPAGSSCATCLWTDTTRDGGGQPLPFLTEVLQPFARWFPPGTRLEQVDVPEGVRVLARSDAAVLVNTTGSPVPVSVLGRELVLSPWSVRWVVPT